MSQVTFKHILGLKIQLIIAITNMKRFFQPFAIFALLFLFNFNFGFSQGTQKKKPKVALVLSGGGAKGIAHIPLLQTLDSLNIVPDMVIGTSMGSIAGGLYAMGYSGDSIAYIAENLKWDSIFNKPTSYNDTGVEEKSEYGKYLIDFEIKNGIQTAPSLINDQILREFIALITFPVYNVNDFDDLAIPFRVLATDIVNGKEVVLSDGSVGHAIRASMSIPGIFEPVKHENTLLIDGGLVNNFPTDVAKLMGADIIIGSDVSGGAQTKEQLTNFGAVLGQAMTMKNGEKYPKNKALCDILINHVPNITFGTKDFTEHLTIYEQGKVAVADQRAQLLALSEQLKQYKQEKKPLPIVKDEVVLDTIIYKGISKENLVLVKERSDIRTHKKYTIQEVFDGVKRAMGTNIFKKITYEPVIEGNKRGIELTGYERSKHQINGSVHYDDYRGVGLIGNYTGRNIIGRASRFLVSVDIAEQPQIMVQYQQIFGPRKNWWWRFQESSQEFRQNVFIEGDIVDDIRERSSQFDLQVNRNIDPLNSYLGAGVNYQYTDLKPRISPDIDDNVLGLRRYISHSVNAEAHLIFNNLDNVFFPKQGNLVELSVNRSLFHYLNIADLDTSIPNHTGQTNNFTRTSLNIKKRIPIKERITTIIDATVGFTFEDKLKADEFSFYQFGYSERFSLGGNHFYPDRNSFSFQGLYENEVLPSQFMMVNIGAQLEVMKNIHFIPHINAASVGFEDFNSFFDDAFSPKGDWENANDTSFIFAAGATIGYDSLLGPINLGASWTNEIDKVRYFLSVGIPLNR